VYKTRYYDTAKEFDDYISAPDYKTNNDNKGVCFGIEQFVDPD